MALFVSVGVSLLLKSNYRTCQQEVVDVPGQVTGKVSEMLCLVCVQKRRLIEASLEQCWRHPRGKSNG